MEMERSGSYNYSHTNAKHTHESRSRDKNLKSDKQDSYTRHDNIDGRKSSRSSSRSKKRKRTHSHISNKSSRGTKSSSYEKYDHHRKNGHHKHHHGHHHYHKRRKRSTPSPAEWDDSEHHLIAHEGDNLTSRYKVRSLMGEGTFGKVVACYDRETKRTVAIKIIRAIEKYRDAAMIEIEILETLRKNDPNGKTPCIQLLSWFDYKDHICMVFDRYGPSLFDFIRKNHYIGFDLHHVKSFAYQLLKSVAFLHDLTLIHTDLKPENILLVSNAYKLSPYSSTTMTKVPVNTDIKLIDFGSATFDSHHHTAIISTRHYRAPEVILGLGWTYPADMWSIGCILVELLTGDAIFQTHENREHLALMEITCGRIPYWMIQKADPSAKKYFDSRGDLVWPGKTKRNERHLQNQYSLKELIAPKTKQEDLFYDLCEKLLIYDPDKRLSAKESLSHPFFASCSSSYSSSAMLSDSQENNNSRSGD